jgi:PAS domain S-box-containing protein
MENRRTEASLESGESYRWLVQKSSDILSLLEADGTVRYVSPATERVLGYAPSERVGRSPLELVHHEDRSRAWEVLARGLRSPGASLLFEVRVRHADGSWRHMEVTGTNLLDDPRAGALILNSRDITERVRAEQGVRQLNAELEARVAERTAQREALVERLEANERSLRESEEQFRTTFELAAVGMAHIARGTGRILRANRRLCEIVGYPREELLLRSLAEITHPDDLQPTLEKIQEELSGEDEAFSLEQRLIRRDYSQVWVRLTASLARGPEDAPDKPRYLIALVEDVTEQKESRLVLDRLTPREVEVLKRLAQGRKNREIASEMNFSVSTVKLVVRSITEKLGAPDRTRAAARAVELGLLR